MKLTLLGGAGFRTPAMYEAVHDVRDALGITELVLYDVDGARLPRVLQVLEGIDRERGSRVPVRATADLDDALEGADVVYSAIRNSNGSHPLRAFHNAEHIISLEHHLGIFHEATIQGWALNFRPLIIAANYMYGSLHFIVTIWVAVLLRALSLSLTWTETVELAGPSGKEHLNDPLVSVLASEPATLLPLAPQEVCTDATVSWPGSEIE